MSYTGSHACGQSVRPGKSRQSWQKQEPNLFRRVLNVSVSDNGCCKAKVTAVHGWWQFTLSAMGTTNERVQRLFVVKVTLMT